MLHGESLDVSYRLSIDRIPELVLAPRGVDEHGHNVDALGRSGGRVPNKKVGRGKQV